MNYEGKDYLFNAMRDIAQFVIIVPISGCTFAVITQHIMQDVLMKFGLCHLVVIDNGTLSKSVFTAMYDCLTINYEVVAKRNHKSVLVEIFYRFLNKSVTIASNDRDTVSIFAESGITTAYSWKNAPTDYTDNICSIPGIGRELRFPLDINLAPLPILSQNQVDSAAEYVCLIGSFRTVATSILQILVEDRWTTHRIYINTKRNIVNLMLNNIVIARTEV